ncbi:MAG: prolipoprotein diacylglyceryl transferase [Alphaproteobacteria bacterium]|nr:MAG: prolipoprotein diacylglyceryl transferase [Alphaproteobacteria bacterium]
MHPLALIALVIDFPDIDPVIFSIGPLSVRWYGMAYLAGLLLAWFYANRLRANKNLWTKAAGGKAPLSKSEIEDFVFWATLGVILGGRLGFVLFYALPYSFNEYITAPWRFFAVWEGGMSFHGGFLGVALAVWFYARRKKKDFVRLGDFVAGTVPIGLGFGRLANFINGELWGRPTDVPWAMIFPGAHDGLPRHPSQLYEAFLEGIVLFIVLWLLTTRFKAFEKRGFLSGTFLAGYGAARIFVEFFRDSDARIFSADNWFTMGMLLSSFMVLAGGYLIYRAHQPAAAK